MHQRLLRHKEEVTKNILTNTEGEKMKGGGERMKGCCWWVLHFDKNMCVFLLVVFKDFGLFDWLFQWLLEQRSGNKCSG